MPSDRDTLADLIDFVLGEFTQPVDIAEHLIAAGVRPPARVITDPDDADRLPIGTVVVNDGGQVAQRYDGPGVWWQILDGDQWDSETLIGTGHITVLHTPENGNTDA